FLGKRPAVELQLAGDSFELIHVFEDRHQRIAVKPFVAHQLEQLGAMPAISAAGNAAVYPVADKKDDDEGRHVEPPSLDVDGDIGVEPTVPPARVQPKTEQAAGREHE